MFVNIYTRARESIAMETNGQNKLKISRAQNFSSVSKIEILILDDIIGELGGGSLATGVARNVLKSRS